MSDGNNKKFKSNSFELLHKYVLGVNHEGSGDGMPDPDVYTINLKHEGQLNGFPLLKILKAKDKKSRSIGSNAFKAYYLPYQSKKCAEIQLGDNADYFFTPELTGCRLVIGEGPNPRVIHIDGNTFDDNAMDEFCNERADFGSSENRYRKRYWDQLDPVDEGLNTNLIDSDAQTIVFGKREKNEWRFYAQRTVVTEMRPNKYELRVAEI